MPLAPTAEERHGYSIMLDVARQTNNAIELGPGTLYGCLFFANSPMLNIFPLHLTL